MCTAPGTGGAPTGQRHPQPHHQSPLVDQHMCSLMAHPDVGLSTPPPPALSAPTGIDVCGQRLAQEVLRLVSTTPSLTTISFMGHSMGGLIARCAIGLLTDPSSSTVAGLEPCCYISIATPHLGCSSSHPEEVRPGPYLAQAWPNHGPDLAQLWPCRPANVWASLAFLHPGAAMREGLS